MSEQDPSEITRFGFTKEEWLTFLTRYQDLLTSEASEPEEKQSDGIEIFEWEAERLRKVFESFKDTDPDVCAVLANMLLRVTEIRLARQW